MITALKHRRRFAVSVFLISFFVATSVGVAQEGGERPPGRADFAPSSRPARTPEPASEPAPEPDHGAESRPAGGPAAQPARGLRVVAPDYSKFKNLMGRDPSAPEKKSLLLLRQFGDQTKSARDLSRFDGLFEELVFASPELLSKVAGDAKLMEEELHLSEPVRKVFKEWLELQHLPVEKLMETETAADPVKSYLMRGEFRRRIALNPAARGALPSESLRDGIIARLKELEGLESHSAAGASALGKAMASRFHSLHGDILKKEREDFIREQLTQVSAATKKELPGPIKAKLPVNQKHLAFSLAASMLSQKKTAADLERDPGLKQSLTPQELREFTEAFQKQERMVLDTAAEWHKRLEEKYPVGEDGKIKPVNENAIKRDFYNTPQAQAAVRALAVHLYEKGQELDDGGESEEGKKLKLQAARIWREYVGTDFNISPEKLIVEMPMLRGPGQREPRLVEPDPRRVKLNGDVDDPKSWENILKVMSTELVVPGSGESSGLPGIHGVTIEPVTAAADEKPHYFINGTGFHLFDGTPTLPPPSFETDRAPADQAAAPPARPAAPPARAEEKVPEKEKKTSPAKTSESKAESSAANVTAPLRAFAGIGALIAGTRSHPSGHGAQGTEPPAVASHIRLTEGLPGALLQHYFPGLSGLLRWWDLWPAGTEDTADASDAASPASKTTP